MTNSDIGFNLKAAVAMLPVSRRTIYRWKKEGLISTRQFRPNGHNVIMLAEINRVRENYGLQSLTPEEAVSIWRGGF